MNTNSYDESLVTPGGTNLHQLVGIAASNILPAAVKRNSFIVNEVPRDVKITTNENYLASLLNTLLGSVVNQTRHSCIRINAEAYDDVIFVSVKDNSTYSNYAADGSFHQLMALAAKMDGKISFSSAGNNFTTVLLSFPNFPGRSQHQS